jgi:hypothetical protein
MKKIKRSILLMCIAFAKDSFGFVHLVAWADLQTVEV